MAIPSQVAQGERFLSSGEYEGIGWGLTVCTAKLVQIHATFKITRNNFSLYNSISQWVRKHGPRLLLYHMPC